MTGLELGNILVVILGGSFVALMSINIGWRVYDRIKTGEWEDW